MNKEKILNIIFGFVVASSYVYIAVLLITITDMDSYISNKTFGNLLAFVVFKTGFVKTEIGTFLYDVLVLFSPYLNVLLIVSFIKGIFSINDVEDHKELCTLFIPFCSIIVSIVFSVMDIIHNGWKGIYIVIIIFMGVIAFGVGYLSALLNTALFFCGTLLNIPIESIIDYFVKKRKRTATIKIINSLTSEIECDYRQYCIAKKDCFSDENSLKCCYRLIELFKMLDKSFFPDLEELQKKQSELKTIKNFEIKRKRVCDLYEQLGESHRSKQFAEKFC